MRFCDRATFVLSRAYAALLVWSAGAVLVEVLRGRVVISFTLGALIAIALYAITTHLIYAMIVGRRHGVIRDPRLASHLRGPLAVGLVGAFVAMALHQHFSPARTAAVGVCSALGIVAECHRALFFAQLRTRLKDALLWARMPMDPEPLALPEPELPEPGPDSGPV
jgi:hypothetical protein